MLKILGLLMIGLMFSLTSVGCGSECGDLQDVCDTCTGTSKTSCEEVANADDATACEMAVEDFQADCGE